MQKFIIKGGKSLRGELALQGSKNSSLPIMAAALLCGGECTLHSCPKLTDVYAAARILNCVGCRCTFSENTAVIDSKAIVKTEVSEELMREMRSSIIFMGAMLGRTGECKVSVPGGCELGPRPIDMHLAALRKMGVDITENGGSIICRAVSGRAKGAKISLAFPSVGATENVILCAVTADGETVINNAAREPEICDLCGFLRSCGADISGDGESRIIIRGKKQLHGCEYTIMPDRIVAATYLSMVAAVRGELILTNACVAETEPFLSVLEQTGCSIYTSENKIYLRSASRLKAVKERVRTMPHPGFPTDAQAVLMAALAGADGTSIFEENIFDCRYRHTDALIKMGADIQVLGKVAVVKGVSRLHGANVQATDLRGGAAMVIGALCSAGVSEITNICHIDRGYEKMEEAVRLLGGDMQRV
ncbi:UDP-N-acetylglucosamine 1-carboxyvinyltransferase [Ruminococcus flavefaciens]|uniref:UDP-N-acetylglucosamine 1-carboxyvinyltransferase n=1 Tax=Ruminococcus flavefaciens TaxID=1265 RepID=UPI0026ED2503|nr:UDP-N-acetylglucosamine 1-carboxyvinyltransferase [Ruminococcus flavefaciens]MDD7517528.1 UDP-N-acetylglucosamine 1-carboxyvinyltransferase [Ruminococcus flavefaciens]MDY5691499.1 UDP-N-acetylglucosamine 1-carboxyvinyltransferase [Ruminococcus flavefaciens]